MEIGTRKARRQKPWIMLMFIFGCLVRLAPTKADAVLDKIGLQGVNLPGLKNVQGSPTVSITGFTGFSTKPSSRPVCIARRAMASGGSPATIGRVRTLAWRPRMAS